ncbi:HHL147Cp [Eremothecium sinecaudum]|uniref:HHL147Cp n=1 Tax=Eremothecium sinecaudum TaxID=45286 RepID=A0A120K2U1_9SACH|nr:HHL147Cp [Eremothecium sinecaudum]AMD22623.1 HHL147Cp [Eremothecium sinecaudum]
MGLTYNRETDTLYSSDMSGYVIAWDMSQLHKSGIANDIKLMTLCTGTKSVFLGSDLSTTIQCGNVVISPSAPDRRGSEENVTRKDIYLKCFKNGALVTLNGHELGIHHQKETKCQVRV